MNVEGPHGVEVYGVGNRSYVIVSLAEVIAIGQDPFAGVFFEAGEGFT